MANGMASACVLVQRLAQVVGGDLPRRHNSP
ncbi:hypothetical protein GA0070613_6172 [Micromonospora inositola]|uniref:Uncharacterized protein n=1 Tax=Micromonospora inositola TaxID=47865 RepID=A0A1C5K3T6_9ACTN|nr:hypothetical protein GA0070613_6172 [Micromonospora inositola]